MKMKHILLIFSFLFSISFNSNAQNYDQQFGLEITGAQGSNLGGIIGGVLKYAFVDDLGNDNYLAFGPSLRYQYFWSNNTFTGVQGSGSMFGFGGFLQFRFFEWFYLGSEVELIQNPFSPNANWTPVGFLGGGIHHDFDFVQLNAGLMYDVIDGLRDPLSTVSSPLRNNYFIRKQNPVNQQQSGGYLPIIARITFFFPIGN